MILLKGLYLCLIHNNHMKVINDDFVALTGSIHHETHDHAYEYLVVIFESCFESISIKVDARDGSCGELVTKEKNFSNRDV